MQDKPFPECFDAGIRGFDTKNLHHKSKVIFAVTSWWLWRWRNERTFTGKHVSTGHKSYWILSQSESINSAFDKVRMLNNQGPKTMWNMLRWSKPPQGWIKVSVDGSSNPMTNSASCGELARNNQGD